MPSQENAGQQIASFIDHTLLTPTATSEDIARLCDEANRYAVAAICISPSRLPIAPNALNPGIGIATVCGFPSGAHQPATKADEARRSVDQGATEIDMVVDLGALLAGDLHTLNADVATVRAAVTDGRILKVIIESAVLDDAQIVAACRVAEDAGADFVKTSTGFHPSGGATPAAVELMAETVGGRLGVKASGGIRDRATAERMIAAGATRLGASSTAAIIAPERAGS